MKLKSLVNIINVDFKFKYVFDKHLHLQILYCEKFKKSLDIIIKIKINVY